LAGAFLFGSPGGKRYHRGPEARVRVRKLKRRYPDLKEEVRNMRWAPALSRIRIAD